MSEKPCSKRDGVSGCCMHGISGSYFTKESSSTSRCCYCGMIETITIQHVPPAPPIPHGPFRPEWEGQISLT